MTDGFTFQVRNEFDFERPCINCKRTVPARTTHVCEAFTPDRAIVSEVAGTSSGFCHCNGFFRGSDHCQCCGCEEYEATCDHVCDGGGCITNHDQGGRI